MSGPRERTLFRALSNRNETTDQSHQTNLNLHNPTSQNNTATPHFDTPDLVTTESTIRTRRHVHVSTLSQRYQATKWMLEESQATGPKRIISKCVKQFPQFFHGNQKARLQKASRWWSQRSATMKLKSSSHRNGDITSDTSTGIRRAGFKAMSGRGRKRSPWAAALFRDLRSEFERLTSAGLKISASVLQTHALHMIAEAPEESLYNASAVWNGKSLSSKITIRWVQHFMEAEKIIIRAQAGKLLVSPPKQLEIEKSVAYHLGQLKRGFESGLLNEDRIENADEIHFIFNVDNGKTLGFVEDKHVKYADVVSGGEPITMMVRLSGGKNACIHTPMLIFKNESRSYPISGVEDNVAGVCYRTGPKGWVDGMVWCSWMSEPRAIQALPHAQQRVLYVDNCCSHTTGGNVKEHLQKIRTTLQKLPPNASHLVQPAESFIIQEIKKGWRKRWDEYKNECSKSEEWMDGGNGTGSRKLKKPDKPFFLKLAADVVREVNALRDEEGVQYARKAMILTGMSLNINGRWEEAQLTDELQQIIAKHRNNFEGEPVNVDTESE